MKYLFWISVKVNSLLEFGLNQGKELFTKMILFYKIICLTTIKFWRKI